jgi:DNA-binding MarR family transcriptional regulator
MSAMAKDTTLVDAWHDVLLRYAKVTSALEHALRDHDLGVSEFEVLERLAQSGENECRMQELSGSVHLSQSALSRVVGRLEADGLVERAMCDTDRRGIYAKLTEAGRERYAAARPVHRAVLQRELA